jgi:hypothetical protein
LGELGRKLDIPGDMRKPMKCDSFTGESHGKYGKIMMNIE